MYSSLQMRSSLFCRIAPAVVLLGGSTCTAAGATSSFSILIGEKAPALEQLAAKEIAGQLAKLFDVDAAVVDQVNGPGAHLILLGNPRTNGHVKAAIDERPVTLSKQGILLRKIVYKDRGALLVAGGSPVATLWAAYEVGYRFGVRYLVHEDVFPDKRTFTGWPDWNDHLEPNMGIRCWRLVNDLADGPVSWSLEENRRFLRQIAKMKYNRVHLSFWPCQPFVQYRFGGMDKPPGKLFFGMRYPIDEDTIGRAKFGAMTEFTNPDFVGADSPEELLKRGIALARGILREAKTLGMETGISIQPFEWPKEFMKVLPGSEPVNQLGNLTAGPGKTQPMDDPLLREMVATIVRAYVETYPEAEYVHVGMPEHRGWIGQAKEAYEKLDEQYGLKELGSYEELCVRARGRTSFPGGGGRVETMLKGDLPSIRFFDSLLREKRLLHRSGGRSDAKIVYNGVVAELFPLLAKIVPPGGEVLSFIDYTASRQLRQRDLLRRPPPEDVPASLIFTLADDNVGVLPQLATGSLHELMKELRANRWSGFYTRYWTVGDLDPTVHYLAQASWDSRITPEVAYRDLVGTVCGPGSVEPALEAFGILEEITKGLDQHGLGFGFPVPGMMKKHYNSGGLSGQIKADHTRYREALEKMRAARQASKPAGRRRLYYFVGRLTFAVKYLDAAEHFGTTAKAEKAGDNPRAAEFADKAYHDIREALTAWANVAEDHGDLGAVALMNDYCYRPIRDKRNALCGAGK